MNKSFSRLLRYLMAGWRATVSTLFGTCAEMHQRHAQNQVEVVDQRAVSHIRPAAKSMKRCHLAKEQQHGRMPGSAAQSTMSEKTGANAPIRFVKL
ncbi:hypothetical protein NPIL_232231 [Nephila pilipes]|uniref:Uncharacterized protein n=1 Tax=Nephila pilipes TaxID=299642 RepID=A0A8X6P2H3_NEPPI|nr:hypothetical protein NPIL_232231 [Nephila pilipes]